MHATESLGIAEALIGNADDERWGGGGGKGSGAGGGGCFLQDKHTQPPSPPCSQVGDNGPQSLKIPMIDEQHACTISPRIKAEVDFRSWASCAGKWKNKGRHHPSRGQMQRSGPPKQNQRHSCCTQRSSDALYQQHRLIGCIYMLPYRAEH